MTSSRPQKSAETGARVASCYDLGPFRAEIGRRKLWKGGELLQLSPKAFDLLALLVSERPRVVEKDELMSRLWPDTVVGEESVTQCISTLRRALGDDAAKPDYVATVPRRGYQYVGPVSVVNGPDDGTSPVTQPAQSTTSQPLPSVVAPADPPVLPRKWFGRWLLAASVALAVAVAIPILLVARPSRSTEPPIRFTVESPPGTTIVSGGVLAPNGRLLTFVATDEATGTAALWMREFNDTSARRLAGTEGASRPFWAPGSDALGFFSHGFLRTVSLADGGLRTLAAVGPMPQGGTWGPRNVIVFGNRRSGLFALFLDTGERRSVTTLERTRGETGHRLPQFLPDGDHFIYVVNTASPEHAGTYVGSLSSKEPPRRLLSAAAEGVIYAEPGFLVYVTDGRLVAQPFDVARLQPGGQPVTLATDVDAPLVTNATTISASTTGLLAYGGGAPRLRLNWFSDTGARLSRVEGPVELHNPVITADNDMVLASQALTSRRGVWAMDTRGGGSRVVTDGTRAFPSPDGRQVAFSKDASGVLDLHVREVGGEMEETLVSSSYAKTITHWTADGRYIVFVSSHPETLEDLWLLPLTGDRQPIPFLQTPSNEIQGEVSPDGKWISYASDESGSWEVYVQRFPSGGWKRAISVNGGFEPHWRRSGRSNRLYYITSHHAMMAVDLEADEVGTPQELFKVALARDEPTLFRNQYAVSADGTRFLIDSKDDPGLPITVVVNPPHLAASGAR
ncbi:MAG: winged helix-turn-helix domain-containing protein [Vicinamibacterales bacterium]